VLVALISKSAADSKIAFFSLKDLFIKLWREAIVKATMVIAMNIYCMLRCFKCISSHIQKYDKLLSHFHKGKY